MDNIELFLQITDNYTEQYIAYTKAVIQAEDDYNIPNPPHDPSHMIAEILKYSDSPKK
jgi:hypothetical protein